MVRRFAIVGIVVMAVAACIGSDPEGSSPAPAPDGGGDKAPGTEGGPCYQGTCLAGLVCSASDLCVRLEPGADGNGPGPSPDGDADAGAAAPDGDAGSSQTCAASVSGGILCPSLNGTATHCTSLQQQCCPARYPSFTATCDSLGSPCDDGEGGTRMPFVCNGKADCLTSQFCCAINTTSVDLSMCPAKATGYVVATVCRTSCATSESIVCRAVNDCPPAAPFCKMASVSANFFSAQLGLCSATE